MTNLQLLKRSLLSSLRLSSNRFLLHKWTSSLKRYKIVAVSCLSTLFLALCIFRHVDCKLLVHVPADLLVLGLGVQKLLLRY